MHHQNNSPQYFLVVPFCANWPSANFSHKSKLLTGRFWSKLQMGLKKDNSELVWFIKRQSWKRVPCRPCRESAFDFPFIINCCPVQIKGCYVCTLTAIVVYKPAATFPCPQILTPLMGTACCDHIQKEMKKKKTNQLWGFPDMPVRLWPWNIGGPAAKQDKSSRQNEIMCFLPQRLVVMIHCRCE